MMKARYLIVIVIIVIALLLLSLVLSAQEMEVAGIEPTAGAEEPPITLNISQPAYPELDPSLTGDADSGNIVEQLFIGLTDVDDETGLTIPELATSWDVSADRTVYTFTLRGDVFWSDGAQVTAEDVRYGILRTLDPNTGAGLAYSLYIIDNAQDYNEGNITDPALVGVDVLNPNTLRIELREPASYLPAILAGWVAFPMPQWAIEAHGSPTWTLPANIVTSGAFNFAETLPDDILILEKNHDYFNAAIVQIEQVNLWIRNANYAWQMYLDGQLDTVAVPDGAEIDPAMDAEISLRSRPGTDYLGFSVSQEPFDDPLVRKAFSAAIDRVALGDAFYGSSREPALTFTPPDVFGHVDGYAAGVGLPYNPTQAQQWLSDAGYPGGAGVPPISLWFNLGRYDYDYYQAIVDGWWNTLGVSVTISTLPWPEYLDYTDTGAAQVWRLGWIADYLDAHNFLSDGIYINTGRFGGWGDPTYDDLIDQAAHELVPASRASLLEQAEEILVETEAIVAPIYYFGNRVATKPYLDRTIPPLQFDLANWRVLTDEAIVDIDGGFLPSSDGRVAIEVPPGAVPEPSDLTLFPMSWTPTVDALVKVGQAYGLHATKLSGGPAELMPGTSYLMHVTYFEDEVDGLAEDTLALYSWDGGQWVRENSSVDTGSNSVTAQVDHFSLFALMAGPDPLPIRLDVNMPWAPNPPDPALAADIQTMDLVEQLFLGLVDENDETGEITPELATSWDISADHTVYTFSLRSDVTWTDGITVTAEDARNGFLRTLDPETDAPFASYLFYIKNGEDYFNQVITDTELVGVQVLDQTTLKITLESPAAHILHVLSLSAAMPIPQWAIDAYGGAWTEPGNIVSNGPFRFAESLPDDDLIILEKNPTYYNEAGVQIEEIYLWTIGDVGEAWTGYLDDRLDTAVLPEGAETDPMVAQELHNNPLACTYYYVFNIDTPPFDDPLVRQAFSAATDRVGMLNALGYYDNPAVTFTPAGVFGHVNGYDEGIGWPYDPDQAQQMLSDAGYPGGGGLPPITLWFNESPGHQAIAETIRDSWNNALGVNVTVDSLPWSEYLTFINEGNAQVWRLGWCADYLDAYNFLGNALSGQHFSSWSNSTYDSLLEQALLEVDPAVRQDLYRQAEEILVMDDTALIPIYHYADLIGSKPYLDRTYPAARYDMANWHTGKVRGAIGTSGGSLVSFDGTITITIPAAAFTDTVILSHGAASAVPPEGPLHVVGQPFELSAIYGTDGKPAEFLPSQSYDLVLQYSDDELGDVDEGLLVLYYWDGSRWLPEPTATVAAGTNQVTATPNHFSVWALMGAVDPLPVRLDLARPPRIPYGSDPETLDPALVNDVMGAEIVKQLFLGLVDVDDESGQILPELATSWTVSADAMVYTFTLRHDVYWSDGDPVTAGDVRYGILRSLDPATGSGGAYPLFIIENAYAYNEGGITDPNLVGITVHNPWEISFSLAEGAAWLPAVLSLPVARPQPQWNIDAHGPAWTEPQNMVNNGPYRLVEWVSETYLLLEKNPDYHDPFNVQIEEIYFWTLPDVTDLWGMYLDDDLDTGPIPEGTALDEEVGQEVHNLPEPCTYFYGYVNNKYPFDDSRVRGAFTQAIDRATLVEQVLDSRVVPLTTFTPPGDFGAVEPGLVGLTYNPTAAQASLAAFLAAEGLTLADFNNLGITLAYNTYEKHEAIANAVAQMWLDTLGVTVILDDIEWLTYANLLQHGTPLAEMPHIFRLGWCSDYPDANSWLPRMFKAEEDSMNFVRRACDDDNCTSMTPTLFDEKLDLAAVVLDKAARETLYYEAEQILAEEEIAYAPLYQYGNNIVTRPSLSRTFGANSSDIANWTTNKVRVAVNEETITSYYGPVTITVPEGTFDEIVILSQAMATGMPPSAGQIVVGPVFNISAKYGASGLPASPSMPFTLTVEFSEGHLGGADENKLSLYYWDGFQWQEESSSVVNSVNNTVTATPDHFSRWAIMVGSGAINGSVILQSRADYSGAEACAWAGGEQITCALTDASGLYELPLPGGSYTVTLEMARFLDAEQTDVTLTDGESVTLTPVTLLGGDINNDCIVNILDLAFMGARFGYSAGDPGYDIRADINNDGDINILDLSVSGGNYQKRCPVPWASWDFLTVPGIPEGARPVNLYSDAPDNLYVWFEVSHDDPLTRTTALYHWDGSTWAMELSYPGYTQGRIHGNGPDDIFVSASCTAADCTGYETPHLAHYDGVTWEEQTVPPEVGSFILDISGAPGEVQAATLGNPDSEPRVIIRYNYGTEQWSHLYTTPESIKAFYFLSADEAYYVTCWGHGRWDGAAWSFKHEFDFCDVTSVWGIRDGTDALHLYTGGKNNFSNGVRIWKYTENPNPALLGTFGSKCGFIFGDPTDCGGVNGIGGATSMWGSAADNVYASGYLGPGADPDVGRVYHYDGFSWQRVTDMGDIPLIHRVWGTGPNDIWFTLRDGRLLHYGY